MIFLNFLIAIICDAEKRTEVEILLSCNLLKKKK